MTREELHGLVWSQPIRTAAASMGISDVALAKRCRTADVPVPPRGWWARKEAGKAVRITPLPPLPFAMANYFPALDPMAVDLHRFRSLVAEARATRDDEAAAALFEQALQMWRGSARAGHHDQGSGKPPDRESG